MLLFLFASSLMAQSPLQKELKHCLVKCELKIKKKFLISNESKAIGKQYKHILSVPFLYVKNRALTQELIQSGQMNENVLNALKECPVADNLKVSVNFPHHAVIYDDNLRVLDDPSDFFCVTPPHAEALLKYCKESDPQLVFYIWGLDDLFVLFDKRVYLLNYNSETKTFSRIEL